MTSEQIQKWYDNRWQIISKDLNDTFGLIRGDATWLSTVELLYPMGVPEGSSEYESCIFTKENSEVLARYSSKEEAIRGHELLAKKYNLK